MGITQHFDVNAFRAKVAELRREDATAISEVLAHAGIRWSYPAGVTHSVKEVHPIKFDIQAACDLDSSVKKEHARIGACDRPNRQLTMLADVAAFLRAVFPSGVTPTGTQITPAVIKYAADHCFLYVC